MKFERRDVFAPASFITLLGVILCLIGAFKLSQPSGLWLILVGRAMDLIDGPVSRATRASRFGGMFDATADKIALAAILTSCFYYKLAPLGALLYILLHNVLNAVASVIAERKGREPVTSVSGKLSMFGENIALLLYVISSIPAFGHDYRAAAVTVLVLSLPFGFKASWVYIKRTLDSHNK